MSVTEFLNNISWQLFSSCCRFFFWPKRQAQRGAHPQATSCEVSLCIYNKPHHLTDFDIRGQHLISYFHIST